MPEWLIVIHLCTFLWILCWAIQSGLDIISKRRSSVSFLTLLFFLFYGVPVLLDVIIGVPDYASTPGYVYGAADAYTSVIYDLFIAACPVFWRMTAAKPRTTRTGVLLMPNRNAQFVLWGLLASPMVALFFAPQPSIYLHYGAVLSELITPRISDFHGTIGNLSVIAVVAGACLLLTRKNSARTLALVLPFASAAMWLQGKRSIVTLCFLLFWSVTWLRGGLTRSRVLVLGPLTMTALVGYISWYQVSFRPLAVSDSRSLYENSRIDYGRDHNLKAAIFCELHGEETGYILDYRGETMLFNLTMYVPRAVWPDKPWPYAVYMTSYALEIPQTQLGWGLTTSFLDESVANFGWVGLLIGPLFLAFLCRVCDRSMDPIVKVMGILIACLFLAVEFISFAPLAVAWAAYWFWSEYSARMRTSRLARRIVWREVRVSAS